MSAPPALELRDLRVRRGGRLVLHVPSLALGRGETLALMGPNGAGKSTLLLAAALLLPVQGEVWVGGLHPRRGGERVRLRRQTATVFQDAGLLDMSVRENVETALRLHGVGRADRRARADHWLARLGIAHLAGARPHTLSGGEAQRASLARAFAVEPAVLLLDEPFAALDLETRARLVGEVRELLAVSGCSALLATHDQGEAALLADRLAVVLDGAPRQVGPVAAVLERPATPAVARFLGHGVLPAALLDGARTGVASIPPEAWWVAPPATPDLPPEPTRENGGGDPVALAGTVRAVGVAHGQGLVTVDVGAPVSVRTTPVHARALRPGQPIALVADRTRVTWHPEATLPPVPAPAPAGA